MSSATDEHAPLPARPDEFQIGAERWVRRAMRELMRSGHPLYAQMTPEPRHDLASDSRPTNRDGTGVAEDTLSHREIEASFVWTVKVDEALSFDVDSAVGSIALAADAFASQIERGVLGHISDITEATGNVVNTSGRDFADAFLDALEQMTFGFNDEGEPNLTIVLHPDQLTKLQSVKLSPGQQARHERIVASKREEWNASQRRRPLPDDGD